jgi:WD40 repeat protein
LYWDNGEIEFWNTAEGCSLGDRTQLPRHVGWCIASPDEATILTGDQMPDLQQRDFSVQLDGLFVPTIRIWDVKSGTCKHLIQVPEVQGHPYSLHEWCAHWLDNSRALLVRVLRQNPVRAAHSVKLVLIDTVNGRIIKDSEEFSGPGTSFDLSPDRKLALIKGENHARRGKDFGSQDVCYRDTTAKTYVVDVERLKLLSSWREPPDLAGTRDGIALIARWCPDGKSVLTVRDGPSYGIRLWDARSGRLLQTFIGHTGYVLDVAFTTTGDKMMTASEDRTIRVWNTGTGKVDTILSGHSAGVNKVVILPGDKLAVSAAEESVAKVWDLRTGKLIFDLPDHDSAVREVEAVSERLVRTVTLRGTSTLWDCVSGKRMQITHRLPEFPKRFGKCELVEDRGMLQMYIGKGAQ